MKKKRRYAYDNSSLSVRRYRRARGSLLAMMIFTVINTVIAATGSYTYYVFSDYLAYYCALYGRAFYEESGGMSAYLVVGCGAAALILVPYLLCWIFSKKRRGWLIAALVLFSIDTALVIWDAIGFMEFSYLLDVVMHIWLIVELVLAIRAGKEAIAEMNAPKTAPDAEFHDASTGELPDTTALGMPQEERKYRVVVEAMYGSHTVQMRRSYGLTELVIDGRLYGKREGVTEMPYRLTARVDGHEIATALLPNNLQTIEVDGKIIAKKFRLR